MKKIIFRVVLVLVVLLVLALAALFFSLNGIVKKGVETVGPQMTQVEVRLASADLSPFSGSGKLSGLRVGNPEGYTNTPFAVQFGSIAVGLKLGSVLSDTVVVNEIDIEQPEISLEGALNGNNLSKLLDNIKAAGAAQDQQKSAPAGHATSKKFIVQDLVLNGAKVHVHVSALNKSLDQTLTIPDIHLKNIGTGEGGVSAAELSRQLLDPLLAAAVKAAGDQLEKSGLEKLTKQGASQLKNATQGVVNDLLKQK